FPPRRSSDLGLGWPTEGIVGEQFENGAVAFFDLQPGLRLALWPRRSLAADAGVAPDPPSATHTCLAHNVRSREEVDRVMAEAAAAGAAIVKPAQETFWGGYGGYFRDPAGHLWEVAWNPRMLPGECRGRAPGGRSPVSRTLRHRAIDTGGIAGASLADGGA